MEHATHYIAAYGGKIFVRLVINRTDVPDHSSARVVSDQRDDARTWTLAPGDQVWCHNSMIFPVTP